MRDFQTKQNAGGLPDSITTGKYGAGEFNSLAVELETSVSSSGQTLAPADGTGEVTDQLSKALAIYGAGGAEYCIDTGVANAYVISPVSPKKAAPAYFDGMTLSFKPGNGNTAAATVNYAALGVKAITTSGGLALSGGEIIGRVTIRYSLSAGKFEIISTGTNLFARSILDGFFLSNGTDVNHDIDITDGVAGLFNGTAYEIFSSTSPPTKRIDATWAEGNGAGGLPSGLTLTADTEYNFFLIGKDDGTIDAGYDISPIAANLLVDATGYSWYRRIGSVFTDPTSNIYGFVFEPGKNFFRFKTPITDISDTTGLDAFQAGTVTVPAGKTGMFLIVSSVADEDNIPVIRSTDGNNTYSPVGIGQTGVTLTQFDQYGWIEFPVDNSSQLEYQITPNANSFKIETMGWYDNRG